MRPRQGRARVEIVLVLCIVVLLSGMILAAISRLRDEARRSACLNNLKQLGLAALNYRDTHGVLPPLTDQGEGARTGRGLPSVFATLIPYLEATPFWFDPDRPADHYHAHSSVMFTYRNKDGTTFSEGGGMVNRVWRTFIDPADGTADRLRDVPIAMPDGTTGHYAPGSYAANGLVPWGPGSRGRWPLDGSANTILFGERPQICRTAAGEEVYNLWGLGVYSPHMPAFAALTPAEPPGLWSTGQVAPVVPLPDEGMADHDARIRVRMGRSDAPPALADFATPVQIVRPGRPCDPRLPGTPHRGGMQATMADGSVRGFGPDTSPWVFWAACTPTRLPADP